MKVSSKGQVTIPAELRQRLGLLPDTEVEFVLQEGQAVLRKVCRGGRRGAKAVAHLRGRGTVALTTEQIMAHTREA